MHREAIFALATCALLGCTHPEMPMREAPLPPAAVKETSLGQITAALAYFQRIQQLDRDELHKEYLRTAADFARTQELGKRIELVLLLSDDRCEFRDPDAAIRLLEGYTAHLPEPHLADFLSLLVSRLEAQRRHEHEARRQASRAVQLQHQLDALRSIEQQIQARDAPERVP